MMDVIYLYACKTMIVAAWMFLFCIFFTLLCAVRDWNDVGTWSGVGVLLSGVLMVGSMASALMIWTIGFLMK